MALSFEKIVQKLAESGIESPRLEARLMIAHAKNCECEDISTFTEISGKDEKKIVIMLEQRSAYRPLDKILGHREFYKYDFLCNDDVLSPRPDTEILVEQAAKLIFKYNFQKALEFGIGSGCVLLSLLADFPYLSGVGIDISQKALNVALQNAERLGVQNRVQLFNIDWNNENFYNKINGQFDIIVSNPPYIPSSEISTLEPEVRVYDPIISLDGGTNGFDAYEIIAFLAPKILKNNGFLLFESGYNQADTIVKICEKNGLFPVDVIKDLSGIDRCVIAQKRLAK